MEIAQRQEGRVAWLYDLSPEFDDPSGRHRIYYKIETSVFLLCMEQSINPLSNKDFYRLRIPLLGPGTDGFQVKQAGDHTDGGGICVQLPNMPISSLLLNSLGKDAYDLVGTLRSQISPFPDF